MDENATQLELEAGDGDDRKYEVEGIWDSGVYARVWKWSPTRTLLFGLLCDGVRAEPMSRLVR